METASKSGIRDRRLHRPPREKAVFWCPAGGLLRIGKTPLRLQGRHRLRRLLLEILVPKIPGVENRPLPLRQSSLEAAQGLRALSGADAGLRLVASEMGGTDQVS